MPDTLTQRIDNDLAKALRTRTDIERRTTRALDEISRLYHAHQQLAATIDQLLEQRTKAAH